MLNSFTWLFTFFTLLQAFGCAKQDESLTQRGFVETEFTDKNGQSHTYLVFVPYDYEPDQNRPLILFLNGKGENGDDGYWTIHNNFGIEVWEMKRHFPFVCAIPQCPDEAGWTRENLLRAFDFADEVEETYGTDKDRVYITGVSQGGQGVWNALGIAPERFAAAIPLCGSPSVDAETIAKSGIPIWNHCNEQDKPALVEANQQMHMNLLKLGVSPLYSEYKASGHNCWDRVYRSAPVYEWMLEQRRTDNRSSKMFRLFSPSEIASNWVPLGNTPWRIADERVHPPEDIDFKAQDMLVSDKAYSQFELHLDACLGTESKGCRLGLTSHASEDRDTPTLEVVLPLVDQGVGEVRSSDGMWKAAIEPMAQRQLLSDYANDIRLSWQEKRLKLYINGCLAADVSVPDEIIHEGSVTHPTLMSDHDVGWQNIRLKTLDSI
ncbi:hypothetical protein C5Y96_19055 [Blastopirellula marina]|uniref:Peptidase S9 prolyl oligopeptidase catalytic domain-containing protein n=1 Tax=Blastopirellula marina TaxID=124 RepID=A0A2S8F649_9BACT|nr:MULTISPECIES: prolyl oligopeptidase family serine peptidase [Pirellulaceae]PQO27627.1 hypothetical protein C5Y96_19055 [Blastopirellula marina]RCS48165.1 hypothetical protein DTL36_19085 [Bremerella cremea]